MERDPIFILKPSRIPGAGVGCFSLSFIPRRSRLAQAQEGFRRLEQSQIPDEYLKYCILLDSGRYLSPPDFMRMSVFWYVNHQKEPNLVFEGGKLFAVRDIVPGEELSLYYSDLLTHPKNRLWVRPEDV